MSKRSAPDASAHDIVSSLSYIDFLPEAGTVREDVAVLRGKLARIAELRRMISDLETDIERGAQDAHETAYRNWTAAEIRSAKDAAKSTRA